MNLVTLWRDRGDRDVLFHRPQSGLHFHTLHASKPGALPLQLLQEEAGSCLGKRGRIYPAIIGRDRRFREFHGRDVAQFERAVFKTKVANLVLFEFQVGVFKRGRFPRQSGSIEGVRLQRLAGIRDVDSTLVGDLDISPGLRATS